KDLSLLKAQLHSLYPRSAVESHQVGFHDLDHEFRSCILGDPNETDPLFVTPLCLQSPYCFPIRTFGKASADPFASLIAIMERLGKSEWALLQVHFCRARHSWAENLRLASQDPYNRRQLLVPGLDQRTLAAKLQVPLYAVAVIVAANRQGVL